MALPLAAFIENSNRFAAVLDNPVTTFPTISPRVEKTLLTKLLITLNVPATRLAAFAANPSGPAAAAAADASPPMPPPPPPPAVIDCASTLSIWASLASCAFATANNASNVASVAPFIVKNRYKVCR